MNSNYCQPGFGSIFVCKDQQQVVAMITVLYSMSTALGSKVATLEDMIVSKQYRSSGIGSDSLSLLMTYAKKTKDERD